MNIFERATLLKIRFSTDLGDLTVEDLWDLPLTSTKKVNLDDIARELHKHLKNDEDVSFVVKERKSDDLIQLKFDIVKYIIDVLLAEKEAEENKKQKSEKMQTLLAIKAKHEEEALVKLPLEEINKLIEDLK